MADMKPPEKEGTLQGLLAILNLEELDVNLFRGQSPDEAWQRVFGGQVIGQALVAASRTVEKRRCHSLHAYFLRAGDPSVPILYEVDRARDGGSFSARRVIAVQRGKQIFNLAASFQTGEEGLEHQDPMPPDMPPPEELKTQEEWRQEVAHKLPPDLRSHFTRPRPIEIRPVAPRDMLQPQKAPPVQTVWFRVREKMPNDDGLHQCVLGYMSDMTLLDTAQRPHGISWMNKHLQVASLDHAMWFYRPFRVDEWLLYHQTSPGSAGGRGFNLGHVFTRQGQLVCSVAQEGLMRVRPKSSRR